MIPQRKRLITVYLEDSCIKVLEDCGPTVMHARQIVLTFEEAEDVCRIIRDHLDLRKREILELSQ